MLFYAHVGIDTDMLQDTFKWARDIAQLGRTVPPPYQPMKSIWLLSSSDRTSEAVPWKMLLGLNCSDADQEAFLNAMHPKGREQFQRTIQSGSVAPMLLHLGMSKCSRFKASNPKDYVYALLSITNLDLEPRYEDDTTVAEVFVEFCARFVNGVGDTHLDGLEFLVMSDLANGNPGPHDLPTWVPNLPSCAERRSEYMLPFIGQKPSDDIIKNHPRFDGGVNVQIDGQGMSTDGFVLDVLSEVSEIYAPASDVHGYCRTAGFLPSLFEMMKRVYEASERSYHAKDHPLTKLASALALAKASWGSIEVTMTAWWLQRVMGHGVYLLLNHDPRGPALGVLGKRALRKIKGHHDDAQILYGDLLSRKYLAEHEF